MSEDPESDTSSLASLEPSDPASATFYPSNASSRHSSPTRLLSELSTDLQSRCVLTSPDPSESSANDAPTAKIICAACEDSFDEITTIDLGCTPKSHYMCKHCLENMFTLATNDEIMFLPHCCQEIDIDNVQHFLDADLASRYREKAVEYKEPNRTYCFQCSNFISPDKIKADCATCPGCDAKTCIICKNQSHAADCPKDPDIEVTLSMAQAEGWQRCGKCKMVVELYYGCNHIQYILPRSVSIFFLFLTWLCANAIVGTSSAIAVVRSGKLAIVCTLRRNNYYFLRTADYEALSDSVKNLM